MEDKSHCEIEVEEHLIKAGHKLPQGAFQYLIRMACLFSVPPDKIASRVGEAIKKLGSHEDKVSEASQKLGKLKEEMDAEARKKAEEVLKDLVALLEKMSEESLGNGAEQTGSSPQENIIKPKVPSVDELKLSPRTPPKNDSGNETPSPGGFKK